MNTLHTRFEQTARRTFGMRALLAALLFLQPSLPVRGQSSTTASPVPRLVNFGGTALDAQGKPRTGMVGITFALYKEEQGGAPLWLETQSVQLDDTGHYTVNLGSTKPAGLPADLFISGEAHWLGVQVEGQPELARVLLVSAPYALKAADAETIGGLPPSAFVLAAPQASSPSAAPAASSVTPAIAPPPGTVSGTGTANFVPLWTDGADIGNSVLFQSGSGSTAKIGINTSTPTTTLDVKGTSTVRGLLTLPSVGVATAAKGSNSQPVAMTAAAFNSGTSAAVNQNFRWQAEPVGNNTATPSGTLNLLFGSGTTAPAETGLKISNTGLLTFATGQTFPGTGTISGVTAGTALTGGGTTGNVTLNLDTTKIPQLNVANTFTGNQTVSGNLSATGVVTGSGYQIGSTLFAFGSVANSNAFLGFSGNVTTTGKNNAANGAGALSANTSGSSNTASGINALAANTTGSSNTASGNAALESNSTGSSNTADGSGALISNTTGVDNTATGDIALGGNTTGGSNTGVGFSALVNNTTGSGNTAVGYSAGPDSAHPNLSNATAIGANAVVTASNALVLGATGTNVGIGTSAPAFTLDVHGSGNFTGPITFAAGQTFPGTGTITGVTAGTGLTGGGSSGGVTLSVDTAKIPQLATNNTFTGNQTVSANLSVSGNLNTTGNLTLTGSLNATGNVSAGTVYATNGLYYAGGSLFAFGSPSSWNSFLGFAGNVTTTGQNNTASGVEALVNNTTGLANTASGVLALPFNTTGSYNTASGFYALFNNGTGSYNTAIGDYALQSNSTGHQLTCIGEACDVGVDGLANATAIGAYALVTESNALVLGSTNGVNGATASTNVGIGTTAPASTLDVEATAPGLVGPIILLKNNAGIQSGTLGNSVDLRFALDGGSSVGNPNAYIRVAEDGNSQYGAWISFATMADGGAGSGPLEHMRIQSNGFVGIGTTAPDALLSVNGGADKTGGGSWATFSDRRLKNLDGDFTAGLSEILKLQPIRYRYKDDNALGIRDRDQHVGFVAQEVQKVIPEAVTENNKGYLLVNNDPILWTMLNAIKEQQQQIEEQTRQIRQQQKQIVRLAGKVGILEAALRSTEHSAHRASAIQNASAVIKTKSPAAH